jgi:taspase (threonine aspartase 1)
MISEKGAEGKSMCTLLSKLELTSLFAKEDGAFGAVGALRGIKNPIQVAAKLVTEERKGRLPLGRIRPM